MYDNLFDLSDGEDIKAMEAFLKESSGRVSVGSGSTSGKHSYSSKTQVTSLPFASSDLMKKRLKRGASDVKADQL